MTQQRKILLSFTLPVFLGVMILLSLVSTCERFPELILEVTTDSIESLPDNEYKLIGSIESFGREPVTQHGFCWAETANPTKEESATQLGNKNAKGGFTSIIANLPAKTLFYVRAYAITEAGTEYGDELSFITLATTGGTLSDYDGNKYNTVEIGLQVWMKENLKTTKYNDGGAIPLVSDPAIWKNLTTPGYCWYNNDEASYKDTYGALYNWYVVNTGKLCPTGWHVPSQNDWTILVSYLGGESVAGGKLKESGTLHWIFPNTGATNESGFTALPGGSRDSSSDFVLIGYFGDWWSSTEYLTTNARTLTLYGNFGGVYNTYDSKERGFSIRCVKDSE